MQWFYLIIVPRVIEIYIPEVQFAIPRHSVLSDDFNIFYSDLDLTLISNSHEQTNTIYRKFFQIKKYFIFMDIPEVRTLDDELKLSEIKLKHGDLITSLWHIRKSCWLNEQLKNTNDSFERLKLERAIKRSYRIISPKLSDGNNLRLSDINGFNKLFPLLLEQSTICLYSSYIPIGTNSGIVINASLDEFFKFSFMLPGEQLLPNMASEWFEAKKSIHSYEIILAKAQQKKNKFFDTKSDLESWINSLELFQKEYL